MGATKGGVARVRGAWYGSEQMARKLFTWIDAGRRSDEERRVAELAATATPPPRAWWRPGRAVKAKKARLLAGILEAAKRGTSL